MRVAIVGAGAAGCFCAVNLKRLDHSIDVDVYEAASRPLAKVAITGGGRCNLTNSFRDVSNLQRVYPRGDKLMRRVLSVFSQDDVMDWFENQGVRLVIQDDQCVFPASQNAMEIVDTLLRLMRNTGVRLHLNARVAISAQGDAYYVGEEKYDSVVIAVGGCPKESKLEFLSSFSLDVVKPVPSLFTFQTKPYKDSHSLLMGTVVENVSIALAGTKFRADGPLLFTHWGMSGPAVLRLSSYSARWLAEHDYKGQVVINWYGEEKEDIVRQQLNDMISANGQKQIINEYPRHLTQHHWGLIIDKCSIPRTQRWNALNKTHLNRLLTCLTADVHEITGKFPFKEEFVTAGGIALPNINIKTMESKKYPGLYFAGEVLDVDAITGGFNLQAAWSMAYVVAQSIAQKENVLLS